MATTVSNPSAMVYSMNPFGDELRPEDYSNLRERGISRRLADASSIRRVTSSAGQQMFARSRGDLAGLIIPNVAPWDPGDVREYRLRLDSPPMEPRPDGSFRENHKYLQPPGRPNLAYFPCGISESMLQNPDLPILIVEGECKSISAQGCSLHGSDSPRFIALSIPGVYGFHGTIGKKVGPRGDRHDVKGLIPDLERIEWKARRVIIAHDADAEQNSQVRAARWQLRNVVVAAFSRSQRRTDGSAQSGSRSEHSGFPGPR